MASNLAGRNLALIVVAVVVLIGGGASVAVVMLSQPTGHAPTRSSQSSGSVTSNTSCNQLPYLVRLASQVEQTQAFSEQSHGLTYTLAYGSNSSSESGTMNGKPIYFPPETSLALYSYGAATTTECPAVLGSSGVVGALWVQVPINSDGSYNLSNMSIYFTPGVFSNSTGTTSASNSSAKQPGGIVVVSAKLVGPIVAAGPTVELTLQNEEGCCVTSLSAILELNNNYTFSFGSVIASSPLDQGQSVSVNQTLIGAGFDSSRNYTLVIKGTTQDTIFTDVTQTQIAQNPAFIYLTAAAICTGPGGYAPCWGDSPYVLQCPPNLLSGPSTTQECTQRVTSTLAPYPSYTITVTIPEVHQRDEPSWANCMWAVQGITPGQGYAYCIAVNSTSFMMGVQAPPYPVIPPVQLPKALLGVLSAEDVSCSLATGVCAFTIVNNSTDPLDLVSCAVEATLSSSGGVTTYGTVNGTIGGPAVAGIPADSQVAATCTVPTAQLSHESVGSTADGSFTVKLVDNWYSYPAGDAPTFSFQGTWSQLQAADSREA